MSFALFENRQTFESLSNLILCVNEHFDLEDYVVVILRTKKYKLDVIKKTWLICDRDERIRESQDSNRRHIASRSIKCSFFMIVKRFNNFDDCSWFLKVINSRHNHFFSLVDAHLVLRKMTMTFEIKNEISRQLIVQIASSQIISSLRIINFILDWDNTNSENSRIINFMFKSRDIYNMKAQLRREAFNFLTFIQALIQELNRDDWTYNLQKDENNQVTHLFFNKESSQSLLKKNFEIFIMNCIYKINKYKMFLLIISDQTTLHINFYVTFCFMTTPRNDSVRSGFCHLGTKPMLVWFFAGSVPVRFGLIWAFTDLKPAKRVHTKTLRCIANKYIYMHLAYAACARAKKKNFSWNLLSWFVAFQIRLNFANQMKTELSYSLWSYIHSKLFATWCSWCSH
jgi:hypothetical protein